jgi:hypothetical protein
MVAMLRLMVLALALVAGCAATIKRPKIKPVPVTASVASVGSATRALVFEGFFADLRPIPSCGELGPGRDNEAVLCEEPPARWLAELLVENLKRAGVVVLSDPDGHPEALHLQGRLVHFYVESRPEAVQVVTEATIRVELVDVVRAAAGEEPTPLEAKGDVKSLQHWIFDYQKAADAATVKLVADMTRVVLARLRAPSAR